jgi:uncharacterized protein involved in exopolysaccharide biosynthesis
MIRLLETFYRHRLLLLTPLVLCTIVGVGLALNQPRVYESTAQLWVDRTSIREIRPDNAFFSPADTQTGVFAELLTTRAFCVKVGHRGPLADYIAQHKQIAGYDPLHPELGSLGWLGNSFGSRSATPDQVDDVVFQTITKGARVSSSGAEIVAITFGYPDPRVVSGTLQALIDQFLEEVQGNRKAQARAAADFYQQRAKEQEPLLNQADAKIDLYLASHPQQVSGPADATLAQLRRDDDLIRRRYESFLQKLDDASLTVAEADLSAPNGFRLIDAPRAPAQPLGRLANKSALAMVAGGIGLGLFISAIGLVLLYLADHSLRRTEDVQPALGLHVVASAPLVRGGGIVLDQRRRFGSDRARDAEAEPRERSRG